MKKARMIFGGALCAMLTAAALTACTGQTGRGTGGDSASVADDVIAVEDLDMACDTAFVLAEPYGPDSAEAARAGEWLTDRVRRWMRRDTGDTLLAATMFTPGMDAKRGRMAQTYGCDAVTFAQDWSDYGIRSTSVRHLGGGWFEVSYAWQEGAEPRRIPMRLAKEGDGWRIAYITAPSLKEPRTDDGLFDVRGCTVVDTCGAARFVETFFRQYTYLYAIMAPRLEERLADMRGRYFTDRMTRAFGWTVEASRGGMQEGYDMLIHGNDFDIHDYGTLRQEKLDSTAFAIDQGDDRLYVFAKKVDGHWKIDGCTERNPPRWAEPDYLDDGLDIPLPK